MAYAAVVSLKHTTHSLLNSSRFFHAPYTHNLLIRQYNRTALTQELLRRSKSSNRLDVLEGQISDAAYKLEDALDFYESRLLSSDEGVHLVVVIQEINSFNEVLRECVEELLNPVPEEDDDNDEDDDGGDGAVEMVGHSTEFTQVRDHLLRKFRPDDMCLFVFIGETGGGSSLIVNTIFEDEKERFESCAWLTIGTCYSVKEIVLLILLQVVDNDDVAAGDDYDEEDEEMVCKCLHKTLEHRRYMIVLDDVRDVRVLDRLRSSFPDQSNGSLVLLTTNEKRMIGYAQNPHTSVERAGDFRSWGWFDLISAVVGEENGPISAEFEQAAKEISANCGGRRLALAKTMLFLHKKDKTVEQWREIAADKENRVFKVEDEISEVHRIKTEVRSHNWDFGDKREIQIFITLTRWINFSDDVARTKSKIYPRRFFSKMEIVGLWGMAGIGKTTYAKKIIQDDSILCNYDHCVWVTLGPKYEAKEILIDILACIYPSVGKMRMNEDDNLVRELCVQLSSKRCLIVFDDVWSKEPLQYLKRLFPEIKGRALVTTRLEEITDWGENDIKRNVRLLDEEESWTLIRQKVFPEGSCTPELEKAGRKIAYMCDGLPLLLHRVADQLLKVEKINVVNYWNEVASGKERSVFTNAHAEISKALLPSYRVLPQHLKAFFLYMGIFRERYDIPVFKLIDLMIAEGFLRSKVKVSLWSGTISS